MMMRRGGAGGGRIISMGGYFREHYLGASPLNYLGASPLNSLNLNHVEITRTVVGRLLAPKF